MEEDEDEAAGVSGEEGTRVSASDEGCWLARAEEEVAKAGRASARVPAREDDRRSENIVEREGVAE